MSNPRDVNVRLTGDASSLIEAVKKAQEALKQLKASAGEIASAAKSVSGSAAKAASGGALELSEAQQRGILYQKRRQDAITAGQTERNEARLTTETEVQAAKTVGAEQRAEIDKTRVAKNVAEKIGLSDAQAANRIMVQNNRVAGQIQVSDTNAANRIMTDDNRAAKAVQVSDAKTANKVIEQDNAASQSQQTASYKFGLSTQAKEHAAALRMRVTEFANNLRQETAVQNSELRKQQVDLRAEKQIEVNDAKTANAKELAEFKANLAMQVNAARAAGKEAGDGFFSGFKNALKGGIGLGFGMQLFQDLKSYGGSMMSSFTSIADQTRQLQLTMGGTAENTSQLRFVADQLGVSTESLATRMGLLESHLAKNDKYIQALGVSYKNADGSVRPTVDVLEQLADKFVNIQDPIKRADLARNVFGRGFQDMLPILSQGSAGIKQLAAESDKLGLTMTGKDVQSAFNFKMQMKNLHAEVTGLSTSLGRELLPMVSGVVSEISKVVSWFTKFIDSNSNAAKAVKTVAVALGAAIVVVGALTLAIAAFEAVVSPIGLVVAALTGLIYWIIETAKTGEKGREALVSVFGDIGDVVGKVGSELIIDLKNVADTIIVFAQTFLGAAKLITDNPLWKVLFGGNAATNVQDAINSVVDFKKSLDSLANSAASSAYNNGSKWGQNFGAGLADFINNFKMPTIPGSLPATGAGATGQDTSTVPGLAGAGGSSSVGKRKQASLDFFKNLVDQARSAYDAAVQAAKDARTKMQDLGKQITDSLNKGFDLTTVADESYATYLGPQALINKYKKKLSDMKDFVGNIKKLAAMGLPGTMLQDLLTQGVDKAGAVAKMLVNNPSTITQLAGLQGKISSLATEAGNFGGQAVYGGGLASGIQNAISSQNQFKNYLSTAQQTGYQATTADITAATQNTNNVVMNIATQADPAAIEQALAWALQTGTGVGVGGGASTTRTASTGGSAYGGNGGGMANVDWSNIDPGIQLGAGGVTPQGTASPGYALMNRLSGGMASAPANGSGLHGVMANHKPSATSGVAKALVGDLAAGPAFKGISRIRGGVQGAKTLYNDLMNAAADVGSWLP